ncbi:hypothetical protein RR46_03986 [Papilio xuthus]|uniref:Uncharacterized protein n=1 Tax=Papilio xuthus TaxID=66420 RepID=A0A194QIC7_PAPXU|nr:hypothetical protein RR46_03986 [Papilio xuthus]
MHLMITRLAQQQDTARSFTRQPPPAQRPRPLDLTASLLQANLTQLSQSPRPAPGYMPASRVPLGQDGQGGQGGQGGANFNNKWSGSQGRQTGVKQDWSAFESLLPAPHQPASQHDTNKNNVKAGSSSEMLDLLS